MSFCFVLVPRRENLISRVFFGGDLYKFVDLLIKIIQVSYTA